MSAGIKLPKTTVNHGFLTFNGQKISKSLGNAISPEVLVKKYGSDTIRYFVCRHFPFASGDDGDFDESALINRHNGELLNKLGNLVSRVTGLIEKNGMQKIEPVLKPDFAKINNSMENFEVDKALNEIFAFIDECNEYVQQKKPWESKNKEILYELADSIKKISILLFPFIPRISKKISEKLGGYEFNFEELNIPLKNDAKISKGESLFIKLEEKSKPNLKKEEEPKEIMENVTTIQFDDFAKINLRVAKIKKIEEIEGADKLYKLYLEDGTSQGRIICAGIKEYYSIEELKDKKIIIVANLAPRKLKGIESQGMLLAATSEDKSIISLLTPDKDIEVGSLVG
jgi:methionyl-tRNA synthetase